MIAAYLAAGIPEALVRGGQTRPRVRIREPSPMEGAVSNLEESDSTLLVRRAAAPIAESECDREIQI